MGNSNQSSQQSSQTTSQNEQFPNIQSPPSEANQGTADVTPIVQNPKPIEKVKNPYPQVPKYADLIAKIQPKQISKYPVVPKYITHELITDIKMLSHILDTASLGLSQTISEKQFINHPLEQSRIVDENEIQNEVQIMQTQYYHLIKNGIQLEVQDKDKLQNQVIESLKLIAKYAFYCQGLLTSLSEDSKQFQTSLNNLILSSNLNSILLQANNYYQEQYQGVREKTLIIFSEFINNNQFHQLITKQLQTVSLQLSEVQQSLQQIIECSNIVHLEDESEESFIQHYLRIQNSIESTQIEFTVQHLQDQSQHFNTAQEKALSVVDDQKYERFVKDYLDDTEGSRQFTLLLRHFIDILEKKPENWESIISFTLMAIQDKDKVRWLLAEFSKLDIQSSLHLVHYCIRELQGNRDKSIAQLQRVVKRIDQI